MTNSEYSLTATFQNSNLRWSLTLGLSTWPALGSVWYMAKGRIKCKGLIPAGGPWPIPWPWCMGPGGGIKWSGWPEGLVTPPQNSTVCSSEVRLKELLAVGKFVMSCKHKLQPGITGCCYLVQCAPQFNDQIVSTLLRIMLWVISKFAHWADKWNHMH